MALRYFISDSSESMDQQSAPTVPEMPSPTVRTDSEKGSLGLPPSPPSASEAASAAPSLSPPQGQWYGKPEMLPFLSLCSRYPGPWAGLLQQTIKEKQRLTSGEEGCDCSGPLSMEWKGNNGLCS